MAEAGIFSAIAENVLICAGACAVTLVPELGGKISSLQIDGKELLQQPLRTPAPRTRTMGFEDGDASGWDECLPSVAACTVTTAAGPAQVPDHGDLWRVAWESDRGQGSGVRDQGAIRDQGSGLRDRAYTRDPEEGNGERTPNSVRLVGRCFSLPLELERSVRLVEKAGGWRLDLQYTLTNTGTFTVPWSWAAHPLFLAEPGDRIVLPSSLQVLRVEGSRGGRLGKGGDEVDWPLATQADGTRTDLRLVQGAESGIGDKLFAGPLGARENWCVLERHSAGVKIRVSFDPEVIPYLGLWICYGGWPEGNGPKQTCVAMEPTTAPVDSLATEGPWSRELAPGEWFGWSMRVDIERI